MQSVSEYSDILSSTLHMSRVSWLQVVRAYCEKLTYRSATSSHFITYRAYTVREFTSFRLAIWCLLVTCPCDALALFRPT